MAGKAGKRVGQRPGRVNSIARNCCFSTAGGAALALGLIVPGTPALAQALPGSATAPAATPPAGPSPGGGSAAASQVEEIVVTAQRREENLQRVPVSVTAVTATTLARANITSTVALQQVTPGLTFTSFGRSALPYIRGIGTPDNSVSNESSVATYVDGVYIGSTPAALFELNNIERVEVLKGPQGTLFGRNATGGLVQIITRDPTEVPSGNFELGYGNYDTVRSSAYLSGPVATHVAADIALLYNKQGKGWGRNVFLGRDVDKDETFAVRSKWILDLDPTRIEIAGDYTHQRSDIGNARNIVPGAIGRGAQPGVAPPKPIARLPGFYDSQSELYPVATLDAGGTSARIDHDLDFAKLTSITAYRDTKLVTLFDPDETPSFVHVTRVKQRIKQFTEELQLTSQGDSAFRWIVGAFFMHRNGYQPYNTVEGQISAALGGITILRNGVKTDVVAPYAQGTLRLGPATELTLGARYTFEHQRFRGTQENAAGVIISAPNPQPKSTYKEPTWRAAINHNFNDDLMVYASYNRGFKSGIYNTNSVTDRPVKPEIADAFEVGFKSQLFDQRLRFNAAAFHTNYKDIQLNVPTGLVVPPVRTINAARARIQGLEASIDAVPVEGLTFSVGASYLATAKYLKFPNAPRYVANTVFGGNNVPIGTFDNAGGRMIRAPRLTTTASTSYVIDVGSGKIDIGANLYYSGRYLFNVDDQDRPDLTPPLLRRNDYQQRKYVVVNAQIAYRHRSGLSIAGWARNLFDKKYYGGVSEVPSGDVYFPAAPRTYGLKLGYSF